MSSNLENFYKLLFDFGEGVCWGNTVKDTDVSILGPSFCRAPFFVINPLYNQRSDSNVTSYRNILVEFDTGTISEQKELLQASGLPYSTLVFSGGKSLHAIISLAEPVQTEAEYRRIAKNIYKRLPTADQKVFNPSRFSRCPGYIRDNVNEQTLLEVRQRVPLSSLLAWIGPIELPAPVLNSAEIRVDRMLPIRVHHFLNYGAPEGNRDNSCFVNACEMLRAGYTVEEIIDLICKSPIEYPEKDIRRAVLSAEKSVRKTM